MLVVIDGLGAAALRPRRGRGPRADDRGARRAGHRARVGRLLLPVADPGLPVGARHRPRPRRVVHPRARLVPPRRGPLRRVRLVVPRDPGRGRARVHQRLDDEPQHPAPLAARADGVRARRGRGARGAARSTSSSSAAGCATRCRDRAPRRWRAASACSTPPTARRASSSASSSPPTRPARRATSGVHGRNDEHAGRGRALAGRPRRLRLPPLLPARGRHGAAPRRARTPRSTPWSAPTRRSARWSQAAAGSSGSSSATRSSCVADHGQTTVRDGVRRAARRFPDLPQFVSSLRSTPAASAIAVAASNRAAMVYRLTDAPPARELAGARRRACPGSTSSPSARTAGRRAAARRPWSCGSGATRPADPTAAATAGGSTGEAGALGLERTDGAIASAAYPNALERIDQILHCVNAGEVVISAARRRRVHGRGRLAPPRRRLARRARRPRSRSCRS